LKMSQVVVELIKQWLASEAQSVGELNRWDIVVDYSLLIVRKQTPQNVEPRGHFALN
jgi:hypothetical protein